MTGAPRLRMAGHEAELLETLERLEEQSILRRIWQRDHTVWRPDPTEISNRLGWLDCPTDMPPRVPEIAAFGDAVRASGARSVVLMAMGGSSLAAEVLARSYDAYWPRRDGTCLRVLDSTDPEAVLAVDAAHQPDETVYLVSTKSGGTVETMSFLDYFYRKVAGDLGAERAGDRFVAITDPGSGLEAAARRLSFGRVWLNDPNIGGRYSALSHFGLVPAAMIGIDVAALLDRAAAAAAANGPEVAAARSEAALLGAFAGALALAGRDKLTVLAPRPIGALGDWIEQLVAESTGKEGRGILPVVGEAAADIETYAPDRAFVHIAMPGAETPGPDPESLASLGHPVIELTVEGPDDLGGAFFVWELATAVMGHVIDIQPFDQPNVESAKIETRDLIAAYRRDGALPAPQPNLRGDGLVGVGPVEAATPVEALDLLVASVEPGPGAYVALQAFLPPGADVNRKLAALARKIGARAGVTTACGYGPRYLHSTGQLHKGDAGHGRFVQLTHRPGVDAPIPDTASGDTGSVTFGVLQAAQALGDRQALLDGGRQVLSIDLGTDVPGGLDTLIAGV